MMANNLFFPLLWQIDYILGKNPQKMSYVVGFGNRYPKHVHHRGASIPKNKIKYNCKGGWKWRDTSKANPNTLDGAMVAGPDKHDGFRDVRSNYNYTEPTLAGNAGLVAALVALSGEKNIGIDKNTIFSAVPPMFPTPPPPPAPWKPWDAEVVPVVLSMLFDLRLDDFAAVLDFEAYIYLT